MLLVCADQVLPLPLKMPPLSLTAQRFVAFAAHTAWKLSDEPEVCVAQAVPFHFKMRPFHPTAQTLLESVPQTEVSTSETPGV